jgi:hypothetical protein
MKAVFIILFFLTATFSTTVTGIITGAGRTGEKPQSKSWFAHGKWWCCLNGKIFRMENDQFTEVQNIGSNVMVDAHWNGTELFLLNTSWSTQQFYKFTYNFTDDNYTIVDGFPITFSNGNGNSLGSPETITLAQDSTGKIWVTLEQGTEIRVYWTESADHKTWNTQGVVVGTGVYADDISSVTALPGGKIGVIWSNQNDTKVHFRMHLPGTPETTWTADEECNGTYNADDHMNFAVAPDGRVFVAVKTEGGGSTHLLLERTLAGSWNQYPVSPGGGTRPNVMYNSEQDEIVYFYQTSEGNGYVVIYRVPSDAIVLDSPDTIINSGDARDVSGTKQVLTAETGCLILAQQGATSSSTVYFYYTDIDSGGSTQNQVRTLPENGLNLKIFPNPFFTETAVMLYPDWHIPVKIQLFDSCGKQVIGSEVPLKRKRSGIVLNTAGLPAGAYILRVQSGKTNYCRKIVRVR